MLDYLENFVVSAAAELLDEIDDKAGVELLIQTVKKEGFMARSLVSAALIEVAGQNLGQNSIKWQKWWGQ